MVLGHFAIVVFRQDCRFAKFIGVVIRFRCLQGLRSMTVLGCGCSRTGCSNLAAVLVSAKQGLCIMVAWVQQGFLWWNLKLGQNSGYGSTNTKFQSDLRSDGTSFDMKQLGRWTVALNQRLHSCVTKIWTIIISSCYFDSWIPNGSVTFNSFLLFL